eukprot:Protomagalhaensia_wolfi_Nauph_80__3648@NODE_3683_length_735_cov_5_024425_g2902_i0_p1_GENE_NODE_3683_length_735_cov_5_024425_g2902_i0NODE_3683_length_735_cov_5_024425_g2902_i0_p1_ORF_typecomplete_len143_score28_28TPR_19/PF14559_6/6_2e12TPR_19/PF14559_6/1_3e08TPR_19/PF14559_6/1_1e08TPR_9/PF13371_6/1_1e07TPR_9/PF13371_6/2_5e12TPR_9/PF13371_6/2e03TPR_16/PF13432_6/2_1e10TPR_16/PF13432_6/0_0052TPR_16/PF13432_6/8e09TPR_16/PF13432_6/1_4e03TPR_15/PF13429_6/0_00015TPR_15/PF13429_6/1_4e12ANAPC3/PF12895_7/1
MGQYSEALEKAEHLLALDADNPDANMILGQCYAQLGDVTKAKLHCDDAVHKSPEDAWAYVARSTALAMLGDFESALADAGRAIELDPNNAYAFNARGQAYFGLHEYQKAADAHSKATKLTPDNKAFQEAFDRALNVVRKHKR